MGCMGPTWYCGSIVLQIRMPIPQRDPTRTASLETESVKEGAEERVRRSVQQAGPDAMPWETESGGGGGGGGQ